MRWKVPMPKEAPKEGHSHVVIAIKGSGGRLELVTQIPSGNASAIMELLLERAAHQATKEPK